MEDNNKMTYNNKKLLRDDKGFVSILVTMIMMIVISLIVLGFALVSSNEQKGSLNRQLSEEAYYAADSGINYATAVIEQNPANPPQKLTCPADATYTESNLLSNAAYGVSYPCLTVNPAPFQIHNTIPVGQPKVIPIDASVGVINSIDFKWYESVSSKIYDGCPDAGHAGSFPTTAPTAPDCDASVLQVDIIPIGGNLENASSVIYLDPIKGNAQVANSGGFVAAPSTTLYPVVCFPNGSACDFTLTGLNATEYYLRVLPIYGSETDLTLSANGVTVALKNAQVDIHSTGKAQDVLQSLEATLDISGTNTGTAPFAIQSNESICAVQEVGGGGSASVRIDPNSNCGSIEQNH